MLLANGTQSTPRNVELACQSSSEEAPGQVGVLSTSTRAYTNLEGTTVFLLFLLRSNQGRLIRMVTMGPTDKVSPDPRELLMNFEDGLVVGYSVTFCTRYVTESLTRTHAKLLSCF